MTEKIPVKERLRAYFNVSTVLFVGCIGGVIIGKYLAKDDVYHAMIVILILISCVGIAIIKTEIEYRHEVKKIDP